MSNSYKPYTYDEFRYPWENAESGFWTVYKKDGSTSTRRVVQAEADQELAAFHYAMAVSYDVMMNTMLELQQSGKPLSISDIALNTIKAVGDVVLKEKQNVGN